MATAIFSSRHLANQAKEASFSSANGSKRVRGTSKAILSMYDEPPTHEVTLSEFESLAHDRLQVLRQIETLKLLNAQQDVQTRKDELENILSKHGLDDVHSDNTSHFILRLAYCRSEELRRWFLTQETRVFRHRFNSTNTDVDQFLKQNGMKFEEVDVRGDVQLQEALTALNNGHSINGQSYFLVPFTEALELVKDRRVFLRAGMAYVSKRNLVSIIAAKFRMHLSAELNTTFKKTQDLKSDKRLSGLLQGMQLQSNNTYQATRIEGSVTKEQIPELAKRDFPLCMNVLQSAMRSENHLKHGGRMQYGLFLKGIGLSLKDALDFWRQSFSRRTPPDKFNKTYAYNIRHNYGKEGKRTSYTPYGCTKIIHSQPAAGDHHGCPFRHFEEGQLSAKLKERLRPYEAAEIIGLVKNMHYQVACQRYFLFTHDGHMGENVGNHPNAYFDDSVSYYRKKDGETAGGSDGAASTSTGATITSTATSATATTPTPTPTPSSTEA